MALPCTSKPRKDFVEDLKSLNNLGIINAFASNSTSPCSEADMSRRLNGCLAGKGAQAAIVNTKKEVKDIINNPVNPDTGIMKVVVVEGFNTVAHLNPNTNNQRNSTGRAHETRRQICPDGTPSCFVYEVKAWQVNGRTVAQLAQDCAQLMLEAREKGANFQTCVVATPNVQSANDSDFNRKGLRAAEASVGEFKTVNMCRKSTRNPVTVLKSTISSPDFYPPYPDGTCGHSDMYVCQWSDASWTRILTNEFNPNLHTELGPDRTVVNGKCVHPVTDLVSTVAGGHESRKDVCQRSDNTLTTIFSKDFNEALHYPPNSDGTCGTNTYITVCLRSDDTQTTIRSKDFDPALHYNLVNNKCAVGSSNGGSSNGGSSSGRAGGSSSGGSSSGGSSSGGSSSGGSSNGGSGPDSGSDPDNSNETGIPYSEWPDYAIDPSTGRPYTVTIRVSLTVPENYVANGKKTTLSYKVDVLCGSPVNRVSCESAGVKVSDVTMILNQGSTHPSMKPCSSTAASACGYYAPQHAKPLTGQAGTFDLYFYTPMHASDYARTTITLSSITIERELVFLGASSVIVAVDEYSTEYKVNDKSSSPVIYRKILGSFGGV